VRSENTSKAAREDTEKKLQILENDIQEHIKFTKRKHDEVLQRQNELENPEDEDEDDDGEAQRTMAIQETQKQARVLEADQSASGVVSQILSKLSIPEVGNKYGIYFSGSHNSGMQIGHSTGSINWNGNRS
jgi:chromosome segregation ATPase